MIVIAAAIMFFFNALFGCYYALVTRDTTSHAKMVHGHMLAAAAFLVIWYVSGG